jgi:hypothetical protein
MAGEEGVNKSWGWKRWTLLGVGAFLVASAVAFLVWRWWYRPPVMTPLSPSDATIETPIIRTLDPVVPEKTSAQSDTPSVPLKDESLLQSENYRLGDVSVGGDVSAFIDDDRYMPLSILSVRGEGVPDDAKKAARVLITWKTSKSATSTIKYGKNTGEAAKTVQEDGFGMSHSAVLPNLSQGTTYVYTISVHDRWGNEASSQSYAVYTGAKDVLLLDLIAGAFTDTFGWALKK